MYPVMINLKDQKVVVIGGGKVASRKLKTLLDEGARITVVSPKLNPAIDEQQITWVNRPYQSGDLDGAKLVLACTNQKTVNAQIMHDAAPSQLVNNTGDKFFSDFYNVAIARGKDFSVMISTDGLSAARSKAIRHKLETILEEL